MKSSFCIDLQRFMLIPTKFPLSPNLFWLAKVYIFYLHFLMNSLYFNWHHSFYELPYDYSQYLYSEMERCRAFVTAMSTNTCGRFAFGMPGIYYCPASLQALPLMSKLNPVSW